MDDLISRQAVIYTICDELDKIDHVPQWVYDRLEKALKQLPSAQPELKRGKWIRNGWAITCSQICKEVRDAFGMNTERCQNCKHWTKESDHYGKCDFMTGCLSHRSGSCEKYEKVATE